MHYVPRIKESSRFYKRKIMNEKDINDAVDFIYTHGKKYAEAKAHLAYVEEFRKSKKAMLMKHAMTNGVKTVAAAEIEAYAAMEYIEHLKAIEEATEQAEVTQVGLGSGSGSRGRMALFGGF
jgi:hypothetical protein